MKEYVFEIAEEDSDYAEVFYGWIRNHSRELIRCKDCKNWCKGDGLFPTIDGVQFHACWELIGIGVKDSETLVPEFHYCGWAERKEEYVTLHPEDIHFNSEEDKKAFYEALAEMKNTRSFTDEEWEFYKKVNREKMQKTDLNIYDLLSKEEE